MAQSLTDDKAELEANNMVNDVLDVAEAGVAYCLTCEEYDIQAIRVEMLKSGKWTPLDSHRNGENSYIRVSYTNDYLN